MGDFNSLINTYIKRCEDVIEKQDAGLAEKLQGEIMSAFGKLIQDISDNLSTCSFDCNFIITREADYIGNIEKLKGRLEVLKCTYAPNKENLSKDGVNVNINNDNSSNNSNTNTNTVTNTTDFKLMFKEARREIENNESIPQEEIQEIIEKINEIENINDTEETRNKKWFKLKPTMQWLGTKGVVVATTVLNLITAILKFKS